MPLPSQNTAFVETTILVNSLLKPGTQLKAEADKSLKAFGARELPEYSIREFRAGPLQYCVWLHNCFVTEKTLSGALRRIHKVMGQQGKRAATGIEMVATQIELLSNGVKAPAAASLGVQYDLDTWMATEMRIALSTLILKAWAKRSYIARNVHQLACHTDSKPKFEKNGRLIIPNRLCQTADCSMRPALAGDIPALKALLAASDKQFPAAEAVRRSKVLRELIKAKAGHPLPQEKCRALGDAIFAFFAPVTSAILTTNVRDHKLLAAAVGKVAVSPQEVLAP